MRMKFLFIHFVNITNGEICKVRWYQPELHYLSLIENFFIVKNILIVIANLSAITKCLVDNKTSKDFNDKGKI